MPPLSERIEKFDPCDKAVKWLNSQPDAKTAWNNCDRGDWMLWLLHKLSKPESKQRKRVVLCCCACAREALRFVKPNETRPLKCIETTEAWANGKATIEEVRTAKSAAAAAYAAAAAAYAAAAADAAAAAADAAAAAADAADAAAYAAAYARIESLKKSADIVRRYYPKHPVIR